MKRKVGIIGMGMRGKGPLKRMSFIEGVKIVAICDLHQENLDKAQARLKKYGMPRADEYIGEKLDTWSADIRVDDALIAEYSIKKVEANYYF